MPSEQSTIDVVQEQINKAYRLGVNFERERCAQKCQVIADLYATATTSRDVALACRDEIRNGE